MWTTLLAGGHPPYTVNLFRDGVLFAAIGLDEWWIMSANQYLADEALKENDLNFKASEIYGPSRIENPLWTTELVPAGDSYDVRLLRGGDAVVAMGLTEWAGLSMTEYVVEDSVEVAEGLAPYGDNIEEVKEAIEQEDEYEADDGDEPKATGRATNQQT